MKKFFDAEILTIYYTGQTFYCNNLGELTDDVYKQNGKRENLPFLRSRFRYLWQSKSVLRVARLRAV